MRYSQGFAVPFSLLYILLEQNAAKQNCFAADNKHFILILLAKIILFYFTLLILSLLFVTIDEMSLLFNTFKVELLQFDLSILL